MELLLTSGRNHKRYGMVRIAIHGALIGAVLTTIIFAKVRNVSFWKLTDIAAPSLLLGQAIGRWGNFMNQEAHGGEVTRDILRKSAFATVYYQSNVHQWRLLSSNLSIRILVEPIGELSYSYC